MIYTSAVDEAETASNASAWVNGSKTRRKLTLNGSLTEPLRVKNKDQHEP